MGKRMMRVLAACVPVLLLASACGGVASAVQCVSPDPAVSCHRSIREALEAAAPGEKVAVRPGNYAENIIVDTPGVQVVGEGGWPGQVVIRAAEGVVVSLNAPQSVLRNVTVEGGQTGIGVTGAGATIEDVIVRSGTAGIDSGATNTQIRKNEAHANGGADLFDAGTATILGTGSDLNQFGTIGP